MSAFQRWNPSAGTWHAGTGYSYDPIGRLASHAHNLAGTSADTTASFTYNPANQIASRTNSNDTYAWTGHVNVNRNYARNGLNQYTSAGAVSFAYDANGNLTSDGTHSYTYDVENRLVMRVGGGTSGSMRYDPLGRLVDFNGTISGHTYVLHSGDKLVAEYNASGAMLRRYVHGPGGGDTPLVAYEGASMAPANMRHLYADERGSIIAVTDAAGNALTINRYDEYGIPMAGNNGLFQYTGQVWLRDMGMYYYKARMYSPTLGRFMQTDPIGYADGMNIYAYVGNDPINGVDPSGRFFGIIAAVAAKVVAGSAIKVTDAKITAATIAKTFVGAGVFTGGFAAASSSLAASQGAATGAAQSQGNSIVVRAPPPKPLSFAGPFSAGFAGNIMAEQIVVQASSPAPETEQPAPERRCNLGNYRDGKRLEEFGSYLTIGGLVVGGVAVAAGAAVASPLVLAAGAVATIGTAYQYMSIRRQISAGSRTSIANLALVEIGGSVYKTIAKIPQHADLMSEATGQIMGRVIPENCQ